MELISINVGLPRTVTWQGKEVSTGIFKSPVPGPVIVGKLNLEGDGQADLKVHGGVDKAVYAYSFAAYSWWEKELGRSDLIPGSFGENLTFSELDENKIYVGDVYELGACQLQVVQPRQPCFKLGIKFNDMKILTTFNRSGRPGIYFRVLSVGKIQTGDKMKLIDQESVQVPLIELFNYYLTKRISPDRAHAILGLKSLNESWRKKLEAFK